MINNLLRKWNYCSSNGSRTNRIRNNEISNINYFKKNMNEDTLGNVFTVTRVRMILLAFSLARLTRSIVP